MSEKRAFQVGDRVRVYGPYGQGSVDTGRVQELIGEGLLKLKLDSDGYPVVHPKQCRRLVKRERRRVWITERKLLELAIDPDGEVSAMISKAKKVQDDVEFVEVRRRK